MLPERVRVNSLAPRVAFRLCWMFEGINFYLPVLLWSYSLFFKTITLLENRGNEVNNILLIVIG